MGSFKVGITASQIISFLRANAHPVSVAASAASGGVTQAVPVTVVDQIRLWEDERRRLTFTDAVIYSSFESEKEYNGVKDYAKTEGNLKLISLVVHHLHTLLIINKWRFVSLLDCIRFLVSFYLHCFND